MRGHGGPVRALAIRPEARELISGSFDARIIVWDIDSGRAKRVLKFHDGAVNALLIVGSDCFASAGEDLRIAEWCDDRPAPEHVLQGHSAPIIALTMSHGSIISAALDGERRDWPVSGLTTDFRARGEKGGWTALARITGVPNAVAGDGFVAGTADGKVLSFVSPAPHAVQLEAPVTALADIPFETISSGIRNETPVIAATADGRVHLIQGDRRVGAIEIDTTPLTWLALSPDGTLIAAAGLRGGIAVIDRAARKVVHRMTGPGLPVWSLAFDRDSRTLFSGGGDGVIRRWDAVAGVPLSPTVPEPAESASSERGAVVFRACRACHTLRADETPRAGPTLAGLYGRRIATGPGYTYSAALQSLDIVWSPETVARLFEIGPAAYTPGSKMPEQTITDAADRQALVDWLGKVTSTK